jgi:hypothetical protein
MKVDLLMIIEFGSSVVHTAAYSLPPLRAYFVVAGFTSPPLRAYFVVTFLRLPPVNRVDLLQSNSAACAADVAAHRRSLRACAAVLAGLLLSQAYVAAVAVLCCYCSVPLVYDKKGLLKPTNRVELLQANVAGSGRLTWLLIVVRCRSLQVV